MKKSDEELFLLKDQRSTNEEDGKQQQNLLGLLRTHVVEHLDMTRELTEDELYASIDEVLMMPQYRKQFSVRILMQLRQAWLSFADVCEIEEVKEFAKAFVLAKRSGASMPFILQKIASQIVLKVQTQSQIETMLAGKKLEQKIMNLMPVGILLYLSVTLPQLLSVMYETMTGKMIMTVCLFIYITAYLLSERITRLE